MVSLLTTNAKLNAAVIGVQDASFVKNILKSFRLKVKLPLLASIDNSRAVDVGNHWSVCGRTHHMEVKQNFLQELKATGIVEFQWVSMANNEVDIFTKNLVGPV